MLKKFLLKTRISEVTSGLICEKKPKRFKSWISAGLFENIFLSSHYFHAKCKTNNSKNDKHNIRNHPHALKNFKGKLKKISNGIYKLSHNVLCLIYNSNLHIFTI